MVEYLKVMDERITQCDKIIQDLISFTRISTPVYSSVTLIEVLESTLDGVETPGGISVIRHYGGTDVHAQAGPFQLLRVFTNLIANANEAMLEGGELTVAVRSVGPSAEVAITDTKPRGPGKDIRTALYDQDTGYWSGFVGLPTGDRQTQWKSGGPQQSGIWHNLHG